MYRAFGNDNELLYVGISMRPAARFSEHKSGSEWFDEVKKILVEPYNSKRSVLSAERKAIREESPKFNIQGTSKVLVFPVLDVDFQSLIRDLRRSGMTQTEIAKKVGSTQTVISRMERVKGAEPRYNVGARLVALRDNESS